MTLYLTYFFIYILLGQFFMLFDVMVLKTPIFFNPIRYVVYILLWWIVLIMRIKEQF
jgi:hypothetical protein